jgi:hypothetical protein
VPWASDIVNGAPEGIGAEFIFITDAGSIIGKAVALGISVLGKLGGAGGACAFACACSSSCFLAKSATLGLSNPAELVAFGSLFKSGVLKALKSVSKLIASFFIASSASLPLLETSSWPNVVKFSNTLGFKAFDI